VIGAVRCTAPITISFVQFAEFHLEMTWVKEQFMMGAVWHGIDVT